MIYEAPCSFSLCLPMSTTSTAASRMGCCGCIMKLIDWLLLLFFLIFSVSVPLLDSQMVLPLRYYPNHLLDVVDWYARDFGNFLFLDKPPFFLTLIWVVLLLLWPLFLANFIALTFRKSWLNSTCSIFGASFFTLMTAMTGELWGSGKAPARLLVLYIACMAMAALVVARGLVPPGYGKRAALHPKKKA